MQMELLNAILKDPAIKKQIDSEWERLTSDFDRAYAAIPAPYMERKELSFHPFVKLLGFLCLDLSSVQGDIIEIGVWKGKSLTLMKRLAEAPTKLIGVDPCALQGQEQELDYFHQSIFPECFVVKSYSEHAIEKVLEFSSSKQFKLLHIDGGHLSENVWADFLIYERFVVPGGYVVFDDYTDHEYSPEVGPAVERLRAAGLFGSYEVIGQPVGYENSYVLRKL
jgi:hypothetical protein